jgi:peptide/nickel transport system substrate-binding protein
MKWRAPLGTVAVTAAATLMVTLAAFVAGPIGSAAAASGPTSITLTEGVQVQPNWWFPNMPGQYCTVENEDFYAMAYRPLVWISNTDTIDYSRSIASSITVSNNDTTFTVHLGNKFKWSNGQPVTAQQAAWDAELLIHTAQPNAVWTQCGAGIGGMPSDWKSVTAPNATTLVIQTTKPVNPEWFEFNGIGQIYPVPINVWQHSTNWTAEEKWLLKVGQSSASPQFKIVDGPYHYGPFSNDAYSTLIWNPKYTGPTMAHIHKITEIYETSEANLWAASLRGEFAAVGIPSQYNSQRFQLTHHGYKLTFAQYGFCFNYAQPNLTSGDPAAGLLKLKYIRQAIQLGLDEKGMIKLGGNIGYQVYGVVPPVPKTVFYDSAVAKAALPYNPARGKQLLEAHGWKMTNGVMTKGGQSLSFQLLYASGSQWVDDSVQLWQQGLKAEGIQMSLKSEPFNQVIAQVYSSKKTWQIAWWGGGWCYEPDYMPTGDGLFTPGGSANTGGFNDPHLNALINQTLLPASAQVEQGRMDAYEAYIAQDLPDFWMPEVGGYNATQTWLHTPEAAWNPVQAITTLNWWYTTAQ